MKKSTEDSVFKIIDSGDNAWLGISREDVKDFSNPLEGLSSEQRDNLHLHLLSLMRKPKYFQWTVKKLLGIELLPVQTCILREMWTRAFPMYIASRGFGKSFLLAVYCLLRCTLIPGTKIVIVGAAFRQSKVIFEYMDTIWRSAPLLQSICSDSSGPRRDVDRCTMRINDSWAMAVPLGDGSKIRGLRAHTIIADEFNSIPTHIYETVVAGFAAVSSNPTQNVKEAAKRKKMQEEGTWEEQMEETYSEKKSNQSIIAGTAGYAFEPYANYWNKYKTTIQTHGDFKKVAERMGEDPDEVPDYMKRLDWKNFSVIRMPYELIPEGFMDDQQVARARATMHNGIYQMEYGACFTDDSQGFFKRSLIHSCVASDENCSKQNWPPWCPEPFDPVTRGEAKGRYVMGIDPASEQDNFAIVILEVMPEHQRVVYVWTTNKKDFAGRKKYGLTDTHDYYSFCARKIRDLLKVFPCGVVGIDSQGGGFTIAEGLRDLDKLKPGERPIYPLIDDDKPKDTDDLPGDHILDLVNFAKADWTAQANHGMRKDLEDKVLIFPRFDTLSLSIMTEKDKIFFENMKEKTGEDQSLRLYDTLEDAVMEVEELKSELSTIVITITQAGRERWNTPEIKLETGKKGRMRKDRYSALVIANMIARTERFIIPSPTYESIGRVAGPASSKHEGRMYVGPEWAKNFHHGTCFKINRNQ
tara:strand:+ start:3520 stop:5610 length:2091 start_codon:yes stop_codon:yes gene_type:complete